NSSSLDHNEFIEGCKERRVSPALAGAQPEIDESLLVIFSRMRSIAGGCGRDSAMIYFAHAYEGGAMRTTASACLMVLALAGPAAAQNGQRWGFVQAGANDVRLFYGLPDSDVVTLSVICNPKRKSLRVADFAIPRAAKVGQKLRVTLTVGTSTAA